MLRLDEKEMNHQTNSGWWKGIVRVILIFFGPLMFIWLAMTIDKSDIFQRTANPQKYWYTQVEMLEQKIVETESFIKDWNDDKLGIDKGFSVNYDELVRDLIIKGKKPEEAKKIASEMIKKLADADTDFNKKISIIQPQVIQEGHRSLDKYKRELQEARKELSRYQ